MLPLVLASDKEGYGTLRKERVVQKRKSLPSGFVATESALPKREHLSSMLTTGGGSFAVLGFGSGSLRRNGSG